MKFRQLVVYYDGPVETELDKAVSKLLIDRGWARWGGTFQTRAKRRYIRFEKEDDDDKAR